MKKLYVNLDEKSYNIYFNDSFSTLCDVFSEIKAPDKLLIVTDTNVAPLYVNEVRDLLINNGYSVKVFTFTAGEANKNMQTILSICAAALEHGMDRKSMIVALGGGVVGDMAGFAAAIYMRGIRFVQIPTTLLSQSDSSVGGKTGIDFMEGKNILGAFLQPGFVYINVSVLKTLPKREFISGMGEVIKHGIIRNKDFFEFLESNSDKIENTKTLINMAYENCRIKADVVSRDEFENGVRADLNFGHTIGHAIESYFDFKITHGECVGIGMLAAGYISKKRGLISNDEFERIENILSVYGFETKLEIPEPEKIYVLMNRDKKKIDGKLKFILPDTIGSVLQVTDVSEDEISEAVSYISKK